MAYPAALQVPPDHARASSSDGGASSVDPGEEAIDIARARTGDRRAIARVVPRIVRRTFRLARRRRRSAAAAVMRANREAVRRAQHDRHDHIRGGAAPPPVECAASLQDIIAPAARCVSAPRAPDPKRPRLTEPPSPPNSGAGGAGAAVAIASSGSEPPINPFVDVTERTAVQPTMLHAVRPPPRMTSYTSVRRSWRRVEASSQAFVLPYVGSSPRVRGSTARLLDEQNDSSTPGSDGSDTSGDEASRTGKACYSLAARTLRAMHREALVAVVAVLRADAVVLRVVRRFLRVRRSAVRRMLDQADARNAAAQEVQRARTNAAAQHSSLQQLTGGACLAAVLAAGALAESPESPSDVDALTGPRPFDRRGRVSQPGTIPHCADALRAGVAAARAVRMAVRAAGGATFPSVSPLFGTLLGCHPLRRNGTAGSSRVGVAAPPRLLDSAHRPRDAFLRLFCRFRFVYCCRIHGTPVRDALVAPFPSTPVVFPSDPRRLETAADGGDCDFNVQGSALVDGADGGRARRARAMHAAIRVAAGPCRDCRLDLRSRAAVFVHGCRTEVWAVEDVQLLRAAVRIVGPFDTCRMARFVPNSTCRRVAEYLVDWGWPGAWREVPTTPRPPPRRDAPLSYPPVLSLPNNSQESVVKKSPPFIPCWHVGACTRSNCRCVENDVPCEKQCGCARTRWASRGPVVLDADEAASISTPADGCAPTDGSLFCSRRISCSCPSPSRCETNSCPCFAADRECDPDACMMCGAHLHPASGVDGLTTGSVASESPMARSTAAATGAYWRLMRSPRPTDLGVMPGRGGGTSTNSPPSVRRCRNIQVQVGARVRLVLGVSRAHGLGVFVAEAAGAGDFVGEYVGEIVTAAEGHRRGRTYDALGVSYLATLSQTTIVDATRVGSRTKFINHSSNSPNLEMKLLSIGGTIRAALFAARDLSAGEEVFFDYGYALDSWVQ